MSYGCHAARPAGLSGDRCGQDGGAAAANLLPAGSTSAASDACPTQNNALSRPLGV